MALQSGFFRHFWLRHFAGVDILKGDISDARSRLANQTKISWIRNANCQGPTKPVDRRANATAAVDARLGMCEAFQIWHCPTGGDILLSSRSSSHMMLRSHAISSLTQCCRAPAPLKVWHENPVFRDIATFGNNTRPLQAGSIWMIFRS